MGNIRAYEVKKVAEVLAKLDGKPILHCDKIIAYHHDVHDEWCGKIYYNLIHHYYIEPCKRHQETFSKVTMVFEEVK